MQQRVKGNVNKTILKYSSDKTFLKEYNDWMVLLRPQQITIGSLLILFKGDAESLAGVGRVCYAELAEVISDVERALMGAFGFDKINYLALMMIDKHVHFHVVPRYSSFRTLCGKKYEDMAWPSPVSLTGGLSINDEDMQSIRAKLLEKW